MYVDSAMLRRNAAQPEVMAFYEGLSPAGRIGQPAEVAAVVSFFVGKDSEWVSGQAINVDGAGVV
jgi:3-oxoacyl-[acyl-carrier protein] reductase